MGALSWLAPAAAQARGGQGPGLGVQGAGRLEPLWTADALQSHTTPTDCPSPSNPDSIPFALGQPVDTDNSSGQLTNVAQSIGIGYSAGQYPLEITTPHQKWCFLNSSTVTSYGPIDVNGVWLEPESGNPLMLISVANGETNGDGTVIEAEGSDTTYGVWVPNDSTDEDNTLGTGPTRNGPIPEASAPLILVGQVNLGSDSGTPWVYDAGTGGFGGIGRDSSSSAITYGGQAMTGGGVADGGLSNIGMAVVSVNVPLPNFFSTGPGGGSQPTASFDYYTVNAIASLPGGGGGGTAQGGGGGNLPPPTPAQQLCQESTYAQQHFSYCNPVKYMISPDRPGRRDGRGARPPAAHTADALSGPLTFTAPDIYIGGLMIQNVKITYVPEQPGCTDGQWQIGGDLELGDYGLDAEQPTYGVNVCGNGQGLGGGAALTGMVPIIPPDILELTELGGSFKAYPVKLTGSAQLAIASGLITIPGCFMAVFPDSAQPYNYSPADLSGVGCSPPAHLLASGPITSFAAGVAGSAQLNVPVIGHITLGSGYGFYISPSYFEFGGSFEVSVTVADIHGDVSGALDLSTHQYNLEGDLNACIDWPSPIPSSCLTLQGILSSAGVGACGSVNVFGVSFGVYYYDQWGGGSDIGVGSCDLGPVTVVVKPSELSADAKAGAGPTTIDVPSGTPVTSITVTGRRHAPLVQVSGPGGVSATSTSTSQVAGSSSVAIIPLASADETLVVLRNPAAGSWTIGPAPGSAPIAGISYRNGLAAPKVTASVTAGQDRHYALHYAILERAGQRVTFAERSAHMFHVIGTAANRAGTLTFTPAISRDRRREIVAMVALSKLPDHNLVVAHYKAPPDPQAGKPTKLTLTHSKRGLRIKWDGNANSVSYVVAVTLSDGRHLLLHGGKGNGEVLLAHVPGNVTGTASVEGLGPDGTFGPAASATLGTSGVPGRVTGLKTVAGKNGVVIRWKAVKGAVKYLLHVTVTGPGAGIYFAVSTKPRLFPSRALRAIRHGGAATIVVRAVSADGFIGPRGVFKYSPS